MATNRYFQCPYCNKKYTKTDLISHIEKLHLEELPDEFTSLRMVFHIVNKKDIKYSRPCRICKMSTNWDESKGRYNFLCGKKSCHDAWVEQMKKDMGDKLGSNRPTSTSEGLQKMLARRKISGTYKFQDGTVKVYTGSYEKKALEFMDKILNIKSEDLLCPGPILQYSLLSPNAPLNINSNDSIKNYYEIHTYISDMYYIPYNLLIEVKDGGNRPNKNEKMADTRKRQIAKEKHIIENTNYNYLRLTDNDFSQLLSVFADIKLHLIEDSKERIIHVNENTPIIGVFPPHNDGIISSLYVVNYLQNNVFSEPEIAITDTPKLQKFITTNIFNELKETDNSILLNSDYSIYNVEVSDDIISTIKNNIGKQVKENFLYEIIFGHKKFSDDQICFEESAIPYKDFYETLEKDNNVIFNEFSDKSIIKKNYKLKEKLDLNKFNKISLSKEFIKNNKLKYKQLSHIKEHSKGYLFIDSDSNFVCILAIEEKDSDEIWIQALEIDKKYKGRGLSYQLIDIAINKFKAKYLSVNKNNELALNIYKKKKFKIYDSTDKMYFMKIN